MAAESGVRCLNVDIDVDVAIVGDGLVGRPLGLALAGRGWRVALIDRHRGEHAPARDPLQERCTAISVGTRDWLDSEGLWDADAAQATGIQAVRVSHRGYFGATRLQADELGERTLGATIDNAAFLASLQGKLAECTDAGHIHRSEGVTPARISLQNDRRVLALQDERGHAAGQVRARLLIGADGAVSRTRELLGIGTRVHDYAQSAILCSARLDREHGGVALERFTADGPLALLPRPDRHMNLVVCAGAARAEALGTLSPTGWLSELARLAPGRLGRFTAAGPRLVVPLQRIEAQADHAERALLLGNAARLLHPVAGQGYNLALRDVAALVSRLDPAVAPDPGEAAMLSAYVAARSSDRRRTVRLTDTLARTFRGEFAPLGHARAAGLLALDAVGPARRAFARLAMGRPSAHSGRAALKRRA